MVAQLATRAHAMTCRIEDITEAQKDCLRLFYRRYGAKEIGRQLGIAPSTVHQRLTAARKTLGVARSMEAARLLAEAEGTVYDGVLYDQISVAQPATNPSLSWASRLPWPLPTRERPTNDLSFIQKIAAIIGLAALFMATAAVYFIAVRMLSQAY